MSKTDGRTIIINKRVQENAEELVNLFKTIEGADIQEQKGVIRITLPERKAVSEEGWFSKESKSSEKRIWKKKRKNEGAILESESIQHITGIVMKKEN